MESQRVGYDWATSLHSLHTLLLEKEMATHSSILAWRIPWTREPGGLWSMGSQRVGHDWSDWASKSTKVDEPRVCNTEWSESETMTTTKIFIFSINRKTNVYFLYIYVESKKMVWVSYLQGRNRDTDVEMYLWTQQGKERMGQMERGIEKYTLSWVK